jgi:predicted short-subunit dehydrogenase-like oxidoreductase (DUF2520 family)
MTTSPERSVALIGPGRAGVTVVAALVVAGWQVSAVAGRSVDAPSVVATAARFGARPRPVASAADGADLVVIAVPDREIAAIAEIIGARVAPSTLVLHLAGAVGLGPLAGLPARVGALHPLQTMPLRMTMARERAAPVLQGAWAAVAGDDQVADLAREMGLVPFGVADEDRASYHAAACIASNHLVALLAQVEACTDVPLAAFLPLVHATIANVADLGPEAALTGPVARGDAATVRSHLDAIPATELPAYVALARRAAVIAGREPDLDGVLS